MFGGRSIAIGSDVYGAVRGVSFDDVSINDTSVGFSFDTRAVPDSHGAITKDIHYGHLCVHNVRLAARARPDSSPISPELKPACG